MQLSMTLYVAAVLSCLCCSCVGASSDEAGARDGGAVFVCDVGDAVGVFVDYMGAVNRDEPGLGRFFDEEYLGLLQGELDSAAGDDKDAMARYFLFRIQFGRGLRRVEEVKASCLSPDEMIIEFHAYNVSSSNINVITINMVKGGGNWGISNILDFSGRK